MHLNIIAALFTCSLQSHLVHTRRPSLRSPGVDSQPHQKHTTRIKNYGVPRAGLDHSPTGPALDYSRVEFARLIFTHRCLIFIYSLLYSKHLLHANFSLALVGCKVAVLRVQVSVPFSSLHRQVVIRVIMIEISTRLYAG